MNDYDTFGDMEDQLYEQMVRDEEAADMEACDPCHFAAEAK